MTNRSLGLSDHLMQDSRRGTGGLGRKRVVNKHSETSPQTAIVLVLWYYTEDERRLIQILQVQCYEDGSCMRANGGTESK